MKMFEECEECETYRESHPGHDVLRLDLSQHERWENGSEEHSD
jgi:hypothetical protein